MMQICEGLAFAHQRGVVHRDMKPANVFVLQNGHVKILDFGIARVGSSELTRTGLLMGTPNYMSPEQARGRRTDSRSDIFSVGVLFYELLSGRKPFVGEDYFETLDKVRYEEPVPLGQLTGGLSPALIAAVQRAMAKDPAARYQSLEDMKADLVSVAEVTPATAAVEDLRESVDRKFAELVRQHRHLVAAIGSAALGDDTLPLADPAASGMGLEAVLRDLDVRNERLKALARTAERLEPAVARGLAAFERGAFAEAIAELDPVLKELPLHQRARDCRERARLEEMRERTVKSAPALDAGTPLPDAAVAAATASSGTTVTGAIRLTPAARARAVLAGVAAVVLSAGIVYVVIRSPSARVVPPAPPAAESPSAPAPGPAPVPVPPAPAPARPVGPPPAEPTPAARRPVAPEGRVAGREGQAAGREAARAGEASPSQ